jgi:hypothetical protein
MHVCGVDAACSFGKEAPSELGIVGLYFVLNPSMLIDAYHLKNG